MADSAHPRYGEVNTELARRWLALPPELDGPFLAVNLMRYRPRAEYADGRETDLTGREADDAYVPLGPLTAVGAQLILAADVAAQPAGGPEFHRVGIVRYPTRASFMEMQAREDFQELHVHKDAGMEFTIIVACEPPAAVAGNDPDGPLVLRLRRNHGQNGGASAEPTVQGSPVAHLDLEDVIVGDERRWDELLIDRIPEEEHARLADGEGADDQISIVLATPLLDALARAAAPPRVDV